MKKIHHSLSDWDFEPGAPLEISTAEYVSPPSSLRVADPGNMNNWGWFFLGTALGACIPDGRLITYHRMGHTSYGRWYLYLRAQALPPIAHPDNCYYFRISHNLWELNRRVASVDTLLERRYEPPTLSAGIWYHYRATFYQWINAALVNVFRISLEIYLEGEWVTLIEYDDSVNQWAESEVNRIGARINGYYATYPSYVDDTEIWRKT